MTFRQCKRRLAARRTGKTLLHCDEFLFRILGETRQTDALSGEMLRRLPFWGFWFNLPADTVFAEGQGALMGAFFTLADHDSQTDAPLLTLKDWELALLFEVLARRLKLLRMKAGHSKSDKARLMPEMDTLLAGLITINPARAMVLCG